MQTPFLEESGSDESTGDEAAEVLWSCGDESTEVLWSSGDGQGKFAGGEVLRGIGTRRD